MFNLNCTFPRSSRAIRPSLLTVQLAGSALQGLTYITIVSDAALDAQR